MEKEEKIIGDLYLAAAFLSYGISLADINRDIPRKQKFIFTKDCPLTIYTVHSGVVLAVQNATLSDLEINFISETLLFPPSYPNSIKRIKAAIHSDDPRNVHLEG